MGLFDTYQDVVETPEITEIFLKENGFKRIVWGNPHYKTEDRMCWELYLHNKETYVSCVIYYFPDIFKGHVTSYLKSSNNKILNNKILGWNNDIDNSWSYMSNAFNRIDIITAIDSAKYYLYNI